MPTSLLKRLVRTVVPPPNVVARANRHSGRVIDIWRELLSERGEVSGAVIAREALAAYSSLDDTYRAAFFSRLATEFGPDTAALRAAAR